DATQEVKGEHLEALDFRVPIALDTLSLVRDHLFTGIGAGQFSLVIPQYRERTIGVNNHKILHPESDWLWLVSETGVLATGALLVLVAMALFRSFREARAGRDRALRMACLTGAALVAIHGVFDVPGHRIALAWSAALLFALSFRTSRDWKRPAPAVWPARFAGLLVLALGGWFAAGVWFGGPPSATGRADLNYDRALAMYREAVPEGGELLITKVPKLTQAIELAEQTTRLAPLDYRPYGLAGRGDLYFDARRKDAKKAFAVESALNSHWAKIPYLQGLEWATIDPALSVDSWREALRRADAADRVDPRYHERRELLRELNKLAKGRPAFQAALAEALKD
ncbi:MAG: O-antigen polymerase, partial [Akkermansiaceae bacterium]|nr:O-antigen polymerase [Akkermansiaceae bacterium]